MSKKIDLYTPIGNLPKLLDDKFNSLNRYLNIFYDGSAGLIVSPIQTSGKVKGARGEFTTLSVDNLIVRSQWTNLYENISTADIDFVRSYNGPDVSTRSATDASVWPYEPPAFSWVDVQNSYIKVTNTLSYGLSSNTIGQEIRIIFSKDITTSANYNILLESSTGGTKVLRATPDQLNDHPWAKLIVTAYDPSWGPRWTIKEYAGEISII